MRIQRSLCISTLLIAGLLTLAATGAVAASGDSYSSAAEAFEALKALEGTWSSKGSGAEGSFEGTEEFRVSAAGTVVMEIMQPGTDHEMINMYHLDGDNLMLTHYCAGGNQPRMKLDAGRLAEGRLVFEFMDATNLDPESEAHIHAASLSIAGDDSVEATWSAWNAGEQVGETSFVLTREDSD